MLLQILTLLGSLAMFLYGMSLMSGGLQKMAGDKMRLFMAKMTSNAGLLALGSAIAVIMGANIGTTVTAWIFALSFGGGRHQRIPRRTSQRASFYMNVVNCFEKMGDFIINISQSVYGAKTV